MASQQVIDFILNPFWAILIGAYLTWLYFRQQNVLNLYERFYSELMDARSVVDTWTIHKRHDEFNSLYRHFSTLDNNDKKLEDEEGEKDKERYYKTLQLAMFMQHLAAMHEWRPLKIHFMVEPKLFEDTFKPNVAAYYLKLKTFLDHRKSIQGEHHPRFYQPFRDLSLIYLEAYACEKLRNEVPEGKRSKEALIDYIDDKANLDLSSSITKQIADCPEMGFINLFLENYGDKLKERLRSS